MLSGLPFVRRQLFLLALLPVLAGGPAFGQQKAPDPDQVAELVVRLTNEFRKEQGREGAGTDAKLAATARYFAVYLAKAGKFSHEADGSNPATRARKHGYDYCIVSENIAHQYSSAGFASRELAQKFVEGWKSSPGHRKNMLAPDVTETGVAVVRGEPGHYYAVQMFGRPASQAVRFSVANRSNAAIRYRLDQKTFPLAPRQVRTHQQCTGGELEFDWPGKQRSEKIRPKNGDRYSIVRSESGGFSLRTE